MILNLYGVTFHPAVVLGPEHDFLFKSAWPQHTVGWQLSDCHFSFVAQPVDLKYFSVLFLKILMASISY
jgi:hypothetical protein